MKRAFTFAELLVVIGIVLLTASISYPVFVSAKKASKKTACLSNLRQIGVALSLYREAENGSDQGSPAEMGFPQHPGPLFPKGSGSLLICGGSDPNGNYYTFAWPARDDPRALYEAWKRYISEVGNAAIVVYDPNHQDTFPKSLHWQSWTALGLRLDGSVVIRTKLGYPLKWEWWHN